MCSSDLIVVVSLVVVAVAGLVVVVVVVVNLVDVVADEDIEVFFVSKRVGSWSELSFENTILHAVVVVEGSSAEVVPEGFSMVALEKHLPRVGFLKPMLRTCFTVSATPGSG